MIAKIAKDRRNSFRSSQTLLERHKTYREEG